MKLIAGLGNKGSEYKGTRHNIGFYFLDKFAESQKIKITDKNKLAQYCSKNFRGEKAILARPLTYMNLSGKAVGFFASKHKINPADILVIHDDMDIDCGAIKIKKGGGAAGHNGILSITEVLQTDGFCRLRVGVGKAPGKSSGADYVLSAFEPAETELINAKYPAAEKFILDFIFDGYEKAAGKFRP